MRHRSAPTIRRARYRAATSRAAAVPRRIVADPFDTLGIEDLDTWIEEASMVMAAAAPKVKPQWAARWAKPIRRELRRLAQDLDPILAASVSKGIVSLIRKGGPGDIKVPDSVWRRFEEGMRGVLEDMDDDLGQEGWAAGAGRMGVSLDYANRGAITAPAEERIGRRVTKITEASRAMLAAKIKTAIERGYSIEQTVAGVPGEFDGLREMVDRWQAENPVDTTTDRATLIALTETAEAYNHGALDSYAESGLIEEVNVYDGPDCGWTEHDDPDRAHGSRRTLEEADEYPISHPHCQRAFGPVVEGAPDDQPVPEPQIEPQPGSR